MIFNPPLFFPPHLHMDNGNQSLTNERYVSILNHCFDDIERFIIRLQHAAAALRELQLRNNKRNGKSGHAGDGLLAIRARGPSEEEFFEILSKFKLAFNLLAKLKGKLIILSTAVEPFNYHYIYKLWNGNEY